MYPPNPFIFPTLLIACYALYHFLSRLPKIMLRIYRGEKVQLRWLFSEILVRPLLLVIFVFAGLGVIFYLKPAIAAL